MAIAFSDDESDTPEEDIPLTPAEIKRREQYVFFGEYGDNNEKQKAVGKMAEDIIREYEDVIKPGLDGLNTCIAWLTEFTDALKLPTYATLPNVWDQQIHDKLRAVPSQITSIQAYLTHLDSREYRSPASGESFYTLHVNVAWAYAVRQAAYKHRSIQTDPGDWFQEQRDYAERTCFLLADDAGRLKYGVLDRAYLNQIFTEHGEITIIRLFIDKIGMGKLILRPEEFLTLTWNRGKSISETLKRLCRKGHVELVGRESLIGYALTDKTIRALFPPDTGGRD